MKSHSQKLVTISMNELFSEKIDAALLKMGYRDRYSFTRDAIIEKLRAAGIKVLPVLSLPSNCVGKRGRTPKSKQGQAPRPCKSERETS